MLKILLRAGVVGVASYGVLKVLEHYKVAEKATVLVDELLTKVIPAPPKDKQ